MRSPRAAPPALAGPPAVRFPSQGAPRRAIMSTPHVKFDAVHAKHEFMGARKCAASKMNPLKAPAHARRARPVRHPGIEKWAKHKEDFHLRFKYTPKIFANSVLWGLVVPISIYYLIRSEQAPPPPSARVYSSLGCPIPCASRTAAPHARRSETTGKTPFIGPTAKQRGNPRRAATWAEAGWAARTRGGLWRWGRRRRRREACSGAPTTRMCA